MSELFLLALREPGMEIASATAWGANVLVPLTFPVLVDAIRIAARFGFDGLVRVVALVFALQLAPETRGRTLELIEINLARGRRVRDLGLPLEAERATLISDNGAMP